jgi:hypothetical protein
MSRRYGLLISVVLIAVAFCAVQALAYSDTGGCRSCHPNFQGGPGNATHDLHVGATQMTNTCTLCHSSLFNAPVDINNSTDGVSCVGCHIPEGLWEHHQAAGASGCSCHQNWPTPSPESTFPPYYGSANVAISNTCLTDPALGGEDYDGDGQGLDNDGDLLYDAADDDCTALPVTKTNWSLLKALYQSDQP